ncbi:unnamed protein product [Rotaria sp. Silwood2]|nr:unnamed protein product [Rotaria sp. Silwood2]
MNFLTVVVYLLHGLLLCQCLTIDEDAVALGKLNHLLKLSSPSVARQIMKGICEMVAECCPQGESLIIKFFEDPYTFPEFCFGKRNLAATWVRLRACSPVERIVKAVTTSQFAKFVTIVSQRFKSTDPSTLLDSEMVISMNDTLQICTHEEIHSSVCVWDHENAEEAKIKAHACTKKVLLKILDKYGKEKYEAMLSKTKLFANYTIHDLADAFPNTDV